jgi:BolA protein
MTIRESLERKIAEALSPKTLEITDESHHHAGHAGARAGGDSHFNVVIVADAFAGKSRVDRQRLVNGLLADEFAAGLHALSLTTLTPEEAARR